MSRIGRMHDDYYDPDRWLWGDDQPENCDFAAAFPDHTGPYDLYRSTYKYTDCGPSVGFQVSWIECNDNGEAGPGGTGDEVKSRWFYCDDLANLGSWQHMNERGFIVTALSVSSIVEGIDAEVAPIVMPCDAFGGDDPEAIAKDYWEAVESVNDQATGLWDDTHGCETCAELAGFVEWMPGDTPCRADCPDCQGHGVPI